MKIGLVSDIKHAGILEELSLWVIGKALKERGVLPVVLQAAEEVCACEPKGCLSEFAIEQFTICAADTETLQRYGIFEQLQGYVTCNPALHEWLGTSEPDKAKVLLTHPLVLGNQVSIHGISEKPEGMEGYLFADIKELTPEKQQWVQEYARRRQLDKIVWLKELQELTPKQYLGYLWMAAAVVTDHYCGTVLSMLHEKEFAVFQSSDAAEAQKQTELLEMLCLGAQLAESAKLPEKEYEIANSLEFRKALHTMRDNLQERLEQELKLEQGEMMVKCPVRLSVSQCTGCEACEAVCPENAIHMEMDKKGFRYPVVDPIRCNECDWCTDVCIKKGRRQLVQYTEEKQPRIYVGEAKRKGGYTPYSGLWMELVRLILTDKEGVLFGSVLNERLEPEIIETQIDGEAMAFAEQRYLKSRSAMAFRRIRALLDEDKFVLFAGLPCECAGLKGYLKRNYPKLFVCEFLCHAVVSEKLFRKYIDFITMQEKATVTGVHFGSFPAASMQATKVLQLEFEDRAPIRRKYEVSQYYQMLENLIPVRESCANCSYGPKKRVGDITLGELKELGRGEIPSAWKNFSIIMANTEKGGRVLDRLAEHARLKQIDSDTLFKYQYKKTVALGKEQNEFFRNLDKKSFLELVRKKQ
ncbi:MAG: Coenzyme F420 hydrogenase/dehydrogenase, beta subunit C-terminal domain [Lachnospiraceae bacterium]|nr:Coenzyme F420 hydrogenase/dehydrogenase, beta subunit C-terminal domain [Lachnospiraceae bacterium]